jgi:prepilin-type N-terminal cleavage/methylation domain-containing protein
MNRNKKKGFTLIELLIVVVIVGILALAAIPLIASNTRDARRSEAEGALGSMARQARVAFAKTGVVPTQLTGPYGDAGFGAGCNIDPTELTLKYFDITDDLGGDTTVGEIYAVSTGTDGTGTNAFAWSGGAGTITWVDS